MSENEEAPEAWLDRKLAELRQDAAVARERAALVVAEMDAILEGVPTVVPSARLRSSDAARVLGLLEPLIPRAQRADGWATEGAARAENVYATLTVTGFRLVSLGEHDRA